MLTDAARAPATALSAKARPESIIPAVIVAAGIVLILLSPMLGPALFDSLWAVEPPAYIGALALIAGLAAYSVAVTARARTANRCDAAHWTPDELNEYWRRTTTEFFSMFDHDLGRPIRRIAGKEREIRAALNATGDRAKKEFQELMDEIAVQTGNFRLMLANMGTLVLLEAPGDRLSAGPTEPAEIVSFIVQRYHNRAEDLGKQIAWWSEPHEFGIVISDPGAIEHIATNLIDNAVTHAESAVEITLTRHDGAFSISVWDDGPGIPSEYMDYLFDQGWTSQASRREEKVSSGLGLFIARTLARRRGGDITVSSVPEPDENHHTRFTLTMPTNRQPES